MSGWLVLGALLVVAVLTAPGGLLLLAGLAVLWFRS